jgi:probable HAF family extracellular repeat protein
MISLRRFTLPTLVLFCTSLLSVPPTHAQSNPVIPDAHVTFTTIDVPGAKETDLYSINNLGDMTGSYKGKDDLYGKGFAVINGNFKLFVYPDGEDTITADINDSRVIAGSSFTKGFGLIVSWLYNGRSFRTIQAPGKGITWAHGLNNDNVMVGGYGDVYTTGFVRVGHGFKTIAPPGNYSSVGAFGINNRGEIVGSADDTGFYYRGGQYKLFVLPGATATAPWGINDNGMISGFYWSCTPTCKDRGFVRLNDRYLSLDYPGSKATFAGGINNAGQVVGTYELDDFTYHGFVTSPITAADFN